jgi:hypothetical protein
MWEIHAIKIIYASHMSRDICQSYMWIVGNLNLNATPSLP